jgi:hypothetical protein
MRCGASCIVSTPDLTNTSSTVDVERLETPDLPQSERSQASPDKFNREVKAGTRETGPVRSSARLSTKTTNSFIYIQRRPSSTTSSHDMRLDSDATGSDSEVGTLDKELRPPEEYGCPSRDEWSHFKITPDASLDSVNSATGALKRFMEGSKLPIAPVTDAELDAARALGQVIIKVNHLPRMWLPFSPGRSMRSLPGILYK